MPALTRSVIVVGAKDLTVAPGVGVCFLSFLGVREYPSIGVAVYDLSLVLLKLYFFPNKEECCEISSEVARELPVPPPEPIFIGLINS